MGIRHRREQRADHGTLGENEKPRMTGAFMAETEGFEIARMLIEVNRIRMIPWILTSRSAVSIRSVESDSWQNRGGLGSLSCG